MSRTLFGGLAALALVFTAGLANAGPVQPFTEAAFHAAQAKNEPILIHVHADWCPTCRAQDPTVARLAKDPAFAKLVILKIDYDTQTAEERALNVHQQSTLIAFDGRRETGRSVGVTDPAAIKDLAITSLH